ncbi:MAG: NADPH-dependent FMN reductase [Alkalispirochaeta sp.]
MTIALVYGSVREGRLGIRLARFLEHRMTARGHHVLMIDPETFQLPLLERRMVDYEVGTAPSAVEQVGDLFASAEAYVFVTGEYNYSVPPALSNIIAHYIEQFHHKPAALASYSYGPFAGVRAMEQLRSMLAGVGLITTPRSMPVPAVQDVFDDEGITDREDIQSWADDFVADLEWYAAALTSARGEQ